MQGSSTGTPTKADLKRWDIMRDIGCICCILKGMYNNPPQIHHIVEGRKRLGNDYTLALCWWHHMGGQPAGATKEHIEERIGPSYALSPRKFKEVFGTQRELLEFQNELISHYTKRQQDEE